MFEYFKDWNFLMYFCLITGLLFQIGMWSWIIYDTRFFTRKWSIKQDETTLD